MKRLATSRWITLLVVVGAPLVVAIGCNDVDTKMTIGSFTFDTATTDSAEGEDDTLHATRTLAGPSGYFGGGGLVTTTRRKTPALPHHIEELSDDSLTAYLKQLRYDVTRYASDTARLACVKPSGACASGDSALAYIEPEIGAHKWKHDSIPANGVIVARITNYADTEHTELRYGFHGKRRTWWVVDRDSTGAIRSRMVERNYSASAPAVNILKSTSYAFYDCGHSAHNGRPARAKWWDCARSAQDTLVSMAPRRAPAAQPSSPFRFAAFGPAAAAPPPPSPRPYARTDVWVTCGQGCCVADP